MYSHNEAVSLAEINETIDVLLMNTSFQVKNEKKEHVYFCFIELKKCWKERT